MDVENYFELEEKIRKIGAEMTIEVLLKLEKKFTSRKTNDAFNLRQKNDSRMKLILLKSAKEVKIQPRLMLMYFLILMKKELKFFLQNNR